MELPPPAGAGNRPPRPAGGNRRWVPAAIIAAGIVVAEGSSSAATEASSTTCQAWKTTRAALAPIPDLPAGWDWDTPNIDVYINNQANAVDKALSLFEPKIAEEPADVAAAARAYIDTRRDEFAAKRNRTYSATERAVTNMALGTLDQLCGLSDA